MSNRELAAKLETGPVRVKTNHDSYSARRGEFKAGTVIGLDVRKSGHTNVTFAVVRWDSDGAEWGISPSLLRFA